MIRPRTTILLLGLVSWAPVAAADGPELTLSVGHRSGGPTFTTEAHSPMVDCVTTPCVTAEVFTEDDQARFTLILDLPISPLWAIELLYTEQDGDFEFRSEFPDIVDQGTYDWSTAQIGVLRTWGHDRLRPFGALTAGVTSFDSSVGAYHLPLVVHAVPRPVDEEVLSGSLAGGLKVALSDHLDLRLEARAWWHDLPARLDGVLWQGEASIGVTYRW